MISDVPVVTTRVPGHPWLRLLVSFPIAGFAGALATDIAYALTADMVWADFSDWLLAGAVAMGVLAAIVACVSAFSLRRLPVRPPILPWALGGFLVLALGLLNNLVHSRDAWTSVVPMGLLLSAVTVVVMIATIWIGSVGFDRRRVAVTQMDIRP